MAKQATGNGPTEPPQPEVPQATGEQPQQQLVVNAQYIKDLSFENPRARHLLISGGAG